MNRKDFLATLVLAPLGLTVGKIELAARPEVAPVPLPKAFNNGKRLPDWIKNLPLNFTESSEHEFLRDHINISPFIMLEDRPIYRAFLHYVTNNKDILVRHADIPKIDMIGVSSIQELKQRVIVFAATMMKSDIADYYDAWIIE